MEAVEREEEKKRDQADKIADAMIGTPVEIKIGDRTFLMYPKNILGCKLLSRKILELFAKLDILDEVRDLTPEEAVKRLNEAVDRFFDDLIEIVQFLLDNRKRPQWGDWVVDKEFLEENLTIPLLNEILSKAFELNNPRPFFGTLLSFMR